MARGGGAFSMMAFVDEGSARNDQTPAAFAELATERGGREWERWRVAA